jgi:hypothetical protein
MRQTRLNLDELVITTFETGTDPLKLSTDGHSSGDGCTVLTTCSPDCCDKTGTADGTS